MTQPIKPADDWDRSTRDYYERHAGEYAAETLKLSMGGMIDQFIRSLRYDAVVVDLGCGGGRDLDTFRALSLSAFGIDWAISLAAIARRYSGCPTVVGDLRRLPFKDATFDGAWASASLLHLRREEVAPALAEARRILKPGGILFASVKEGTGEVQDQEGRWFTFFERTEWAKLLATNGFVEQRNLDSNRLLRGNVDIGNAASGSWITTFARRSPMLSSQGRRP